jgi:uncharacterized protein (DUF58 family)
MARLLNSKAGALLSAAAAAWACGRYVHHHGYVALVAIMTVLVIGTLWPWVSVHFLRATLSFEQLRCGEGQPVDLRLIIRNRWIFPAWGVSIDTFAIDRPSPGLSIARVPALKASTFTQPVIFPHRGEYPQATPRLSCGFPFGLWRPAIPVAVERTLLVWPAVVPVAPLCSSQGMLEDGSALAQSLPDHGHDVCGVRPYRRGDRLRHVHWGQTARHDQLLVREVQGSIRPRVHIVLHAQANAFADLSPAGPRESAIRVAASLFAGWLDQGACVGLEAGEHSFPPAVASAFHRTRVLDALAKLNANDDMPPRASAPQPRRKKSEPGLVVVITSDCTVGSSGPVGGEYDHHRLIRLPARWPDSQTGTRFPQSPCWIDIPSLADLEPRLRSR